METQLKGAEIRRLRSLLTDKNVEWSIDWSLEQLENAARTLGSAKPEYKGDALPVTLFFEIVSFEYTVREISVVKGDPFDANSSSYFLTAVAASPLVFWLPEISSALVVVVSLSPTGRFAVPLEDLLGLDTPVESTFTIWNPKTSGNFQKIDSVRARLRASVQHSLPLAAPVGKSYAEILDTRKLGQNPADSPRVSVTDTAATRPVLASDWSRCSPDLLLRHERLCKHVAQVKKDNQRLSQLLARFPLSDT